MTDKKNQTKTEAKAGTKKADEHDALGLKKYLVGVDVTNSRVEIYEDQYIPNDALRIVGEFEVNPVTLEGPKDGDVPETGGDHILITYAKQVLDDLEIDHSRDFTFADRASNAPRGSSYVMTHAEREAAIRNGERPEDVQEKISDNIDKAAAKYEKD